MKLKLLRVNQNFQFIKAIPLRKRYSSLLVQNKRCFATNGSEGSQTDNASDLPKAYDPVLFEESWNQRWTERLSQNGVDQPIFRMILPPPNVTGKLHLGHWLTLAIQDMIARWKIMSGHQVEWTPGFDHAGIATHTLASRKLQREPNSSTPEKPDFQQVIQDFASDNLNSIKSQLQSSGALLNWESEYYTLDDNHSAVVKEAFIQLFEAGVIQRGEGIVNWSCSLKSSIADVEVDQIDFTGKTSLRVPGHNGLTEFGVLYYCAYTLEDSDKTLVVATSRPETMFGDTALAVNPVDSRYKDFIGKRAINPINGEIIPIIADFRVKTDFGTGVVKITPAHSKLDFIIGSVHNLPKKNIFTPNGFLNNNTGSFEGMARFEARKAILDTLDHEGALLDSKEYTGAMGLCSRTGDVIEPKLLPHWFLRTQRLTDDFMAAIKSGKFLISPDHHRANLVHRLENCQDWCLSRQIQWGHKIPVYRRINHPEEWISALDLPSAKAKLERKYDIVIENNSEIIQDEDVLDTWFSSSLIPLSLSGWPDSKNVKPISLMETGNDILLFWVWRMVIVTLALSNEIPFNHVLLHGIVSDRYGRKMSKSKGNVIDPMHIINGISFEDLMSEAKQSLENGEIQKDEYDLRISAVEKDYPEGFRPFGRDALRFALLSQNIQTEQINLDTTYLENCRHFANKMWQSLRFYAINNGKLNQYSEGSTPAVLSLTSVADLWILACLYEFAADVEKQLDAGQFHLYAESIRKFFYQQLCDVYIEMIKSDLKAGIDGEQHLIVMQFALMTGLKISHPLIPFVTEEIWSRLTQDSFLIDQKFPKSEDLESFENPKLNDLVMKTMKIVKEIRSLKVRTGLKVKSTPQIFLEIAADDMSDMISLTNNIQKLSGCKLEFGGPPELLRSNFITVIFQLDGRLCKISSPKGEAGAAFLEAERAKIIKLQMKLSKLKQQYENPKFQQLASAETKEKLRKRLESLETQINEVSSSPNETTQSP